MSYWDMPGDIPDEKAVLERHGATFEVKDKYCFRILMETGLIVEVCAYPEGDYGVSTDITLKEIEDEDSG